MKKILTTALLCIFSFNAVLAEENKKPFVKEHKEHKHKINLVNAAVYQQIKDFGAVYNTSHLFFEYNIDVSQLLFLNASLSFGDGITNKLNEKNYSISSTADDLESYLKDINNTGRKYILEFYYQKSFENFVFIGGLIDSTAFIDTNNYANDEHTQFLNSAFVNNPIAVLPSYNLGVYLKYKFNEDNSLSAVFMDNSPEDDNVFITEYEMEKDFYGFRIFGFQTTKTSQNGIGISADYTFNGNLGLFFRGGYSNTDYNVFLSLGFEKFKIILDKDSIGLAYGFINGKGYTRDINIAEIFYEVNPKDFIAITFDVQYMKEVNEDFIFGARLYLSY